MEQGQFNPQKQRDRVIADAELLSEGADYNEKGLLIVTEQQEVTARKEMEMELMAKKLMGLFSIEEMCIIADALIVEKEKFQKSDKEESEKIDVLWNRMAGVIKATKKIIDENK